MAMRRTMKGTGSVRLPVGHHYSAVANDKNTGRNPQIWYTAVATCLTTSVDTYTKGLISLWMEHKDWKRATGTV